MQSSDIIQLPTMQNATIITIAAGMMLFVLATAFEIRNGQNNQGNNGEGFLARALDTTDIKTSFNQLLEESKSKKEPVKLKGEELDQINFLFLGIGGEEHVSGNYLTDTIILITFVPSSKKSAAISIPRDLLVRSPDKKYFTRINALYAAPEDSVFPGPMGVEYTKKEVENITGITPDYYAVLDLAGVEKIVDILGGINIRRIEDLEDNYFPDDNYGYQTYEIEEGWRHLNGEDAAKYIRTRHTPGGDFDRMKRQQEVALAIKRKVSGLSVRQAGLSAEQAGLQSLSGLPKLLSLYQALQDHFTTDLKFNEIMRLMELGENTRGEEIIFERITAEKDGLLVPDTVLLSDQRASVLKPRAGEENYGEIREKVSKIIKTLKNDK